MRAVVFICAFLSVTDPVFGIVSLVALAIIYFREADKV